MIQIKLMLRITKIDAQVIVKSGSNGTNIKQVIHFRYEIESIRVLGWVTGLSILMAMLTDIMLLPLLLLKTENRWRISRK